MVKPSKHARAMREGREKGKEVFELGEVWNERREGRKKEEEGEPTTSPSSSSSLLHFF